MLHGISQLRHFLRQINTGRAPRDAPATAHAARCSELILPGCELVSQPLPITTGDTVSDGRAVHVAEIDVEATVPFAFSLDMIARQIRDLSDCGTEARRTNHRAVCA